MALFLCFQLRANGQVIPNGPELYKEVVKGTVLVTIFNDGKLISYGSGFQVNNTYAGWIVTNHHVIDITLIDKESNWTIIVYFQSEWFTASVYAIDSPNDLAILKILPNNHGTIPLLPSGDVDIATPVMAIGKTSYEAGFTQHQGTVNNQRGRDLQHDAHIDHGYSGGPLVNDKGQIVGVNVAKLDKEKFDIKTSGEINFAIKVSVLRNFLLQHGIYYRSTPLVTTRVGQEERNGGKVTGSDINYTAYGQVAFYSSYASGGLVDFWVDDTYVGQLTTYLKWGTPNCNTPGLLKVNLPAGTHRVKAKDQRDHYWEFNVYIDAGYCKISGIQCINCYDETTSGQSWESYSYSYRSSSGDEDGNYRKKIKYKEGRSKYDKDPTRIAIKFGAGYQFLVNLLDQSKIQNNNLSINDASLFGGLSVAYRVGVNEESNRGHLLGLFGMVGNMNHLGLSRLLENQHLLKLEPDAYKPQNLFMEYEAGFVFKEWFRLSGGLGFQNVNINQNTSTIKQKQYFTATTGFSMRFARGIEWDVLATFISGGDYRYTAYRINTSLNIRFAVGRF
jgi:hypothetical protein